MAHAPYPIEQRFWKHVDKTGDCWLWTGAKAGSGYGLLRDLGHLVGAHRIAWELANGPIPRGLLVCHSCDNRPCVNVAHLFLGTQKANMQDASNKSQCCFQLYPELIRRGEAAPHAKLVVSQVIDIRKRYATGLLSYKTLAQAFGVTKTSIYMIIHRKSWSHVP